MIQCGMEAFVGRTCKHLLTESVYTVVIATVHPTSGLEFWLEDENGNLTFVGFKDVRLLD